MTDERSPTARGRFVTDVGLVLLAWIVLVGLESLAIGLGFREQFVGSWEMAHARYHVSPIAVGLGLPLAVVAVGTGHLFAARQAHALAALGGAAGAAVGLGVSSGRHLASLALRGPFVLVVALAAGGMLAVLARRAPLDRPRALAGAGALLAIGAWLGDSLVLPRLYPAFHAGLLGLVLAGMALTTLAVREQRGWRPVSIAALVFASVCAFLIPRSARAVTGDDNLRRVLVEHAPLLGRAVLFASLVAPPPPIEDDAETRTTAALVHPTSARRALDWTGHDLVVVTIDALRADHVSSYGYARPTTPNIDRLAARGARFEHAYCPTPHTSYSVTSMMTGKYMRPLLALDAGADSETWASYLRRYDFRTAAFYPPAVFFIDEHRFRRMKEQGLGFEYRKEEFAAPELRRQQIAAYVAEAPKDTPLFLWVHLFEPHEPYVMHPEHSFGGSDGMDAYDSEIATADAEVGSIVEVVEKRRPGAVFVISADHGEEFGDHGGRYHGTTVYEEQVRVPLIVVAPGVPPSVVQPPVQTIDLLPTTLAALDVPQPSRIRGRDVGALLAGRAPANEEGLAFSETDDYTLLARGPDRLVCVRKIASCTLFDVAKDPHEKTPIANRPERVLELRKLTAAIERENGKLEAPALPEALRRGLQGDQDAAEDVATLFDDARVDIRREAARCAFKLRAPAMKPQLARALAHDEDEQVKRWSALALMRLGDPRGRDVAEPALHGTIPRLRLATAIAFAEQGDARGEEDLSARWSAGFGPGATAPGDLEEARELLNAFVKIKSHMLPWVALSIDDVRLRPYIVEALATTGDPKAGALILAVFAAERYVDIRPREARALLKLGVRDGLLAPLRRFAGVPDPLLEAVAVARDAGLLEAAQGGWKHGATTLPTSSHVDAEVTVAGSGPARLLVIGLGEGPHGQVDGQPITLEQHGDVWTAELPAVGPRAHVELDDVAAFWIVRRAPDLPPPAPREWKPEGGL